MKLLLRDSEIGSEVTDSACDIANGTSIICAPWTASFKTFLLCQAKDTFIKEWQEQFVAVFVRPDKFEVSNEVGLDTAYGEWKFTPTRSALLKCISLGHLGSIDMEHKSDSKQIQNFANQFCSSRCSKPNRNLSHAIYKLTQEWEFGKKQWSFRLVLLKSSKELSLASSDTLITWASLLTNI